MKYDHAHVILYPTLKHYNRLNYFFLFFIVVPIQVYQLNYLICEYGIGEVGHMKAVATHNNDNNKKNIYSKSQNSSIFNLNEINLKSFFLFYLEKKRENPYFYLEKYFNFGTALAHQKQKKKQM